MIDEPIMKIEDLLSYGFKEWPINPKIDKHERHWQFCYRDKIGKKFYVQVRLWEFSKHSTSDRIVHDSFDAYCQFDMNGRKTFNVDFCVSDMVPSQVVDWVNDMFEKMNCTYYEKDEQICEEHYGNCQECGAYIAPPVSFLCPKCQYKADTGFKQPKQRRKRK